MYMYAIYVCMISLFLFILFKKKKKLLFISNVKKKFNFIRNIGTYFIYVTSDTNSSTWTNYKLNTKDYNILFFNFFWRRIHRQ